VNYVYILYSSAFDKYYIGQTNDLEDRIIRHNSGRETYTKKYTPWRLEICLLKDSRSEAIKLEKKLKNLSKQKLKAFISKYN
jgi:putative endonuclease